MFSSSNEHVKIFKCISM